MKSMKAQQIRNQERTFMINVIKRIMFRNKIASRVFIFSICAYFVLKMIPILLPAFFVHVLHDFKLYTLIKNCYDIIKELCSILVTTTFFNLIYEDSKTKNKLRYIVYEYKQMKFDILHKMISSIYPLDTNTCDNLTEKYYINPKEAQSFFTQDQFFNVIDKLGKMSLRTILNQIQNFLDNLSNLNNEFVSNGNYALHSTVKSIKKLKAQIDQWVESKERFLDWSEQATPKTCNRLYCLFCQESDNKDPIHENLSKIM